MATLTQQLRRPFLVRATPQMVVILLVAALAAAWTWNRARDMGSMPGTMGMGPLAFMAMWALMMSAMMLPSMAPFASMYSRTVQRSRMRRLTLFGAGYLAVWTASGVPAFALAWVAGEFAGGAAGTTLAAGVFAVCGAYQLTSLKYRCLTHCRTPMGHLLHTASLKGPLRDLRAGLGHGSFCLSCCWSLMLLMVAFGVMNIPAMIALAAVVAAEKLWRWGEPLSRGVGVVSLAAAVAVIWIPELAPGLTSSGMMMGMEAGAMDGAMGGM